MRIGLCILLTNAALVSRGVLGTKQELGIVLNERVRGLVNVVLHECMY